MTPGAAFPWSGAGTRLGTMAKKQLPTFPPKSRPVPPIEHPVGVPPGIRLDVEYELASFVLSRKQQLEALGQPYCDVVLATLQAFGKRLEERGIFIARG